MTGEQLYAHYIDCFWCTTQTWPEDEWKDLTGEERRAWNRLAQCVTDDTGCTIPWITRDV